MLDAVLRVYSQEFEVEQFLDQHPELVSSDSFNKGDLDMFGNPSDFSGFDVIIAEQSDAESCMEALHLFLYEHQETFVELKQDEIHCILDFDVTVEGNEQMPDSLALPVDLLAVLAALNIAVEFSAYPTRTLN